MANDRDHQVTQQAELDAAPKESGLGIGKQTLAYGDDGPHRLRVGGNLLGGITENWPMVHYGVGQVRAALNKAQGVGVAWNFGALHGAPFQDGNRPAQWLTNLL